MRKLLYMFLAVALIQSSAVLVNASNDVYYTNREGIEMNETEYNNLLHLGFTDRQIERMDYTTFNENKDVEAVLQAQSTQYYKNTTIMRNGIEYHTSEIVTEEQMLNEKKQKLETANNQTRSSGYYYNAVVATDYVAVTTRIALEDEDSMRYKVDVDWFDMPSSRSYDILGIGIEPSKVQISSSVHFREDWRKTNGTYEYMTACYPKNSTTGGAVVYELPSSSIDILEAYVYFNVSKIASAGTVTSLHAAGDYAHAESNVSSDVHSNYTISNNAGIVLDSPYAQYYSSSSPATASFVGSW